MKNSQSGASCHMTNFQTTSCVCDGEKIDAEQKVYNAEIKYEQCPKPPIHLSLPCSVFTQHHWTHTIFHRNCHHVCAYVFVRACVYSGANSIYIRWLAEFELWFCYFNSNQQNTHSHTICRIALWMCDIDVKFYKNDKQHWIHIDPFGCWWKFVIKICSIKTLKLVYNRRSTNTIED